MAQYFRSFGSDSTGSLPADFTERWDASGNWTVETYSSTRALKNVDPDQTYEGVTWDDIDSDADRDDVEVYVNWVTNTIGSTTETIFGITVRADTGTTTPDNAYWYGQRTTTVGRLRKRVSGVTSTILSPSVSAAIDTEYHTIFRANGNNFYVKQWTGAIGDEPGTWNVINAQADSSISAAGYVGIMHILNAATLNIIAIGVGTNGDSAPKEAVTSGNDVYPGAGSVVVQGYAPSLSQPRSVAPSAGEIVVQGFQPSISQPTGTTVSPGVGSIVVQGFAPGVSQPRTVSPGIGNVDVLGFQPSISQPTGTTVYPGAGSIIVQGYVPGVSQPRSVTNGFGSVDVLGFQPSISTGSSGILTASDIAAISDLIISLIPSIADAVILAAQTSPIHSDVRKVKGQTVVGTGTESDPWGP